MRGAHELQLEACMLRSMSYLQQQSYSSSEAEEALEGKRKLLAQFVARGSPRQDSQPGAGLESFCGVKP